MKRLVCSLPLIGLLGCSRGPSISTTRSCCSVQPETHVPIRLTTEMTSIFESPDAWETDANKRLTFSELRGQPCVITFFFAHCAFKCPLVVDNLRQVQASLSGRPASQIRFVLITLDPVADTSEVLRSFRAEHRLAADNWILLRGNPSMVRRTADQLGYRFRSNGQGGFDHDSLITVLGPQGNALFRTTSLTGGTDRIASHLRAALGTL